MCLFRCVTCFCCLRSCVCVCVSVCLWVSCQVCFGSDETELIQCMHTTQFSASPTTPFPLEAGGAAGCALIEAPSHQPSACRHEEGGREGHTTIGTTITSHEMAGARRHTACPEPLEGRPHLALPGTKRFRNRLHSEGHNGVALGTLEGEGDAIGQQPEGRRRTKGGGWLVGPLLRWFETPPPPRQSMCHGLFGGSVEVEWVCRWVFPVGRIWLRFV